MNKQGAQVFIATTNGLVQVQSISALTNPNLHSVATVGNTSQLAGISSLYRDYVDKPQGLIRDLFDNKAYRLNLSNGIDQGESWQLGVFIAHYLFQYNCLSNGKSVQSNEAEETDPETSKDIIFIATGKVDTLHYHVLPIDELSKKCRHANTSIAKWQSLGHQVCYLAPTQNFRQPILDCSIKLTPIAHLQELYHLCSLYGLPTQALLFPDSLGSIKTEYIQTNHTPNGINQEDIVDARFIDDSSQLIDTDRDDEKSDTKFEKSALSQLSLLFLTVIVVGFLWLIVRWTQTSTNTNEIDSTAMQSNLITPVHYIVTGEISQNRALCLSATNVLISHGKFAVNTQSNATNLRNLCNLFVTTSKEVDSLWLVSDTKAIIQLKGIQIDEQTLVDDSLPMIKELLQHQKMLIQWSVPIPKSRAQTRQFTILAFLQLADDADLSSLDSYLFQLHQQGKKHNMEDLQIWIDKTQAGKQVLMFEQELSIF